MLLSPYFINKSFNGLCVPWALGSHLQMSLISSMFILCIPVGFKLFPKNEEISTPPPGWLLIRIYIFYENWLIETFRQGLGRRGREQGCYFPKPNRTLWLKRIFGLSFTASPISIADWSVRRKYFWETCMIGSAKSSKPPGFKRSRTSLKNKD